MGLANYSQLQASVASWATRSDLAATIPDFITWAQQEIGRLLRSNFQLARADVTVSGEFAAQPTDFGSIASFRLAVTPTVRLSVTSPAGAEDAIASNSTATYPSLVAIEGAQFHFAPLYATGTTGKLLYHAIPAVLVNPTDTNPVLTKYPYLYLYGALEALYRFIEDDNNADRYGALFGGLIQTINAQEARDAMSGPLSATPSGSVV